MSTLCFCWKLPPSDRYLVDVKILLSDTLLGKTWANFPFLPQPLQWSFPRVPNLSRTDSLTQGKTNTDIKYNYSHHIWNVFFSLESCYILLQFSYSPKNCIKNVCLLDKGKPFGFPFTSLHTQINFYSLKQDAFYGTP